MNKSLKKFIIRVLISGALFALVLYAFDAGEGKEFSISKFLLRMFVFGTAMALVNTFVDRRSSRIEKENG